MMNIWETMETSKIENSRIREIDIAKAIGIICVIIGHRTWGSPANRIIYLFHMPLFFILAGFMIKDGCLSLKQIFSKECKLFASYLFYSSFFILVDMVRSGINSAIYGIGCTLTLYGIHALWFLSSLWMAKIFVRLIMRLNIMVQIILVFSIYSVCFFVSTVLIQRDYYGILQEVFRLVTWTIVRTGVIAIFVYLGWKLKKLISFFIKFLKERNVIISLLSLLAAFIPLFFLNDIGSTDYHLLKNGVYIINILVACCGTVLVISLASIISRASKIVSKLCVFVGLNSLHFMASEYFGFSLFSAIINKVFLIQNQYLLFAFYSIVLCFAIYLIAPLFNKMIDRISHLSLKQQKEISTK